jgi:hypothetical protein
MNFDDLQLIRDVDIRWSSTVLMISRALELEVVSDLLPTKILLLIFYRPLEHTYLKEIVALKITS